MFNCTRIKSVEYYEAQRQIADAETEGLRPSEVGRNGEKRDSVSYYQDNGAAEAAGVWYIRKKNYDPETGEVLDTNPNFLPTPSPFKTLEHGAEVDGTTLRKLAAAKDPITGQPIQNDRTKKDIRPVGKDGQPKGSVGYDMQLAAPKSVSVLAAAADPATRERIFALHDRAVERALDFVVDDGLLYSRSGKGGHDREKVTEIAAARYRHFTSRAGDPLIHSHNVFLNMAKRADGSIGTLDNHEAMRYGAAIGAMYRTELAALLKAELGLEVEQAGRAFEVMGVSEKVVDRFSKRRQQIEKEAAKAGIDTAKDRQAAQNISFDTRGDKDDLPPMDELEARWDRELAAEGWNRETLWESALAAGRNHRAEQEKAQKEDEKAAPSLIERARKAVDSLMENEAVFERRQLFRAVFEELQTSGATADEALATIERMETEQYILQIGTDGNEPVYSTGEMIEFERNMLKTALERRGEREFISSETLDQILAKFPTIKDEQEAAIRHALNDDGVTVIEGLAGTGKSFATRALKEVVEAAGGEVMGIAPSWKATDVLRTDAELAEDMAKAVAGTINRLKNGDIEWNRKTVVVVDEAGMVGTKDMAQLVHFASESGAKLVLQGDTRQLQPVVCGSPMKALASSLGAARMEDIQRQKGLNEAEGAWMRAASVDFATGDPSRALEAYDRAGAVRLVEDRDELIDALVSDYMADRDLPDFVAHPEGKTPSRTILTGWNVDVAEINKKVRAALQEKGDLAPDLAVIEAMPRNGGKPVSLALAEGDEIIFGEQIKLDGLTIQNADMARIERIEGDPQDPLLTFECKGRSVTAKASELVGYRDPEGDTPAVPKFQHSYAMTIHASQGVTIDRAWVANIRGMGRESTYVAMSRHRHSVKLFAETGRIYDSLLAQQGGKTAAVSSQGVSLPEEDDTPTGDVTPEAVKKALFAEAQKSDRKKNASDYVKDLAGWAGVTTPAEEKSFAEDRPKSFSETTKAVLDKIGAHGFKRFVPTLPGSSPTLSQSEPAKPSFIQEMGQRAEARKKVPEGYKAQWRDNQPSGRISQDERNLMVRANLMQFAQDHLGFSQKAKEAWRGGATLTSPKGEEIAFSQKGEAWVWSTAKHGASEGGMIWNLVSREMGMKVGEAMHWLRDKLNTWREDPSRQIEAERGRMAQGELDPQALRKLQYRFSKMDHGASPYLVEERGLDPALLKRLGANVKSEGFSDYAGGNKGGAAFAHRNAEGTITSFARRGYSSLNEDGEFQSFRRWAAGGEPNLFQAQLGTGTPSRIYASESAIDAISRYQLDGQPEKALLTATDGQPSDRALELYRGIARKHQGAEWHVAMDDDEAGRNFAEKVKAAILEGDPNAKILDRSSPPEYKDANDELRGITRQQAAKIKAEEEAKIRAEEEARRIEEERKRQEQESRAAQSLQNRPKFM